MEKTKSTDHDDVERIDLGAAISETKGPGGEQLNDGANIKYDPVAIYAD